MSLVIAHWCLDDDHENCLDGEWCNCACHAEEEREIKPPLSDARWLMGFVAALILIYVVVLFIGIVFSGYL